MLNDFRLALLALFEPVAWRVVLFGLFLAGGLMVLLALLVAWVVMATDILPWTQWRGLSGGLGFVLALLAGYFMFPSLFSACAGLFTEYVADGVEKRHYPQLPPARTIGLVEQMGTGLTFARRNFVRNLFLLPFYFVPIVNFFVFVLGNRTPMAYEYFMTVALRRLSMSEANALYMHNEKSLKRTGSLIALLFIIPVLNLVAPVVATALMTHRSARLTP